MLFTCLPLIRFWIYHPALLYGSAFLLGLYCHFYASWTLIIPCLSLWLPFLIISITSHFEFIKPLLLSLFLFLTAWCYATIHFTFPILPLQGVQGHARITIQSFHLQSTIFGERWLYQGHIQQFIASSPLAISSLPIQMSLPKTQNQTQTRPLANQDYWITGRLMQSKKGGYFFKISSKTKWIPIEHTSNWAEQRFQWKRKVTGWIHFHLSHSQSATFLSGLATGEFDDRGMREQFARFGLQHILAISGFHFAIIASFLSLIFSIFLPHRISKWLLLICLSCYCIFLGAQASILRAWTMCSLTLIGSLIYKQTTALNSLGIALLAVLGYDPLLSQTLGFQLSFGATAAILLFFDPAQQGFNHLLPKRKLSEMISMTTWNQHGYCILCFLRQGLALTLAVNLFALPMTLFYFQQFPWLSLLYNLFFPFLVSGSMCLLILGGLLTFIPFLAQIVHTINDYYTAHLLRFTYQVPSEVDHYLSVDSFPPYLLVIYLCFIILGGIWLHTKHSFSEEASSFQFI